MDGDDCVVTEVEISRTIVSALDLSTYLRAFAGVESLTDRQAQST